MCIRENNLCLGTRAAVAIKASRIFITTGKQQLTTYYKTNRTEPRHNTHDTASSARALLCNQ